MYGDKQFSMSPSHTVGLEHDVLKVAYEYLTEFESPSHTVGFELELGFESAVGHQSTDHHPTQWA